MDVSKIQSLMSGTYSTNMPQCFLISLLFLLCDSANFQRAYHRPWQALISKHISPVESTLKGKFDIKNV